MTDTSRQIPEIIPHIQESGEQKELNRLLSTYHDLSNKLRTIRSEVQKRANTSFLMKAKEHMNLIQQGLKTPLEQLTMDLTRTTEALNGTIDLLKTHGFEFDPDLSLNLEKSKTTAQDAYALYKTSPV